MGAHPGIKGLLLLSILASPIVHGQSGPWFTGPLLAPAGHTIPPGHTNVELYGVFSDNDGTFNRHWRLIHTPRSESVQYIPLVTKGLMSRLDLQISVPYQYNNNQGQRGSGLTDNTFILGFQALEQRQRRWIPDLRVSLQEIIPIGRFDRLSPNKNGTDSLGLGSYQTGIGLNFQHLLPLGDPHFLRTRLSLNHVFASSVEITGLSSYGGAANTQGRIAPGEMTSVDLAFEFTMTQHWVAVMEGYFMHRDKTKFTGFVGTMMNGLPAQIGHGDIDGMTIAPAMEYNFNEHYGMIAGVWWALKGKETTRFITSMIAFNAYW